MPFVMMLISLVAIGAAVWLAVKKPTPSRAENHDMLVARLEDRRGMDPVMKKWDMTPKFRTVTTKRAHQPED